MEMETEKLKKHENKLISHRYNELAFATLSHFMASDCSLTHTHGSSSNYIAILER